MIGENMSNKKSPTGVGAPMGTGAEYCYSNLNNLIIARLRENFKYKELII